MDDLHPYDGRERRFRHTDQDADARARGRSLASRLLCRPEPIEDAGLRYDLSYHSGGMGVLDRLFVELPAAPARVAEIARGMDLRTPDEARADPEWGEDFEWLVTDEDDPAPTLHDATLAFIEDERGDRLPAPRPGARVWVQRCSNVNSWLVLYESAQGLCVMAYDQG